MAYIITPPIDSGLAGPTKVITEAPAVRTISQNQTDPVTISFDRDAMKTDFVTQSSYSGSYGSYYYYYKVNFFGVSHCGNPNEQIDIGCNFIVLASTNGSTWSTALISKWININAPAVNYQIAFSTNYRYFKIIANPSVAYFQANLSPLTIRAGFLINTNVTA